MNTKKKAIYFSAKYYCDFYSYFQIAVYKDFFINKHLLKTVFLINFCDNIQKYKTNIQNDDAPCNCG